MSASRERCRCGHAKSAHWEPVGCVSVRCENVCVAYAPVLLPDPGERPVFGVHHIAAEDAWTPEPLSEYWSQDKRWKP